MQDDFDALRNQLAHEVMSGMKEWRQHPKAKLREIEAAPDDRLGKTGALHRMCAGADVGRCGTSQCGSGLESCDRSGAAEVSRVWGCADSAGVSRSAVDRAF